MPSSASKKATKRTKQSAVKKPPTTKPSAKPRTVRLLSGDNPQIPLAYGDAPVQDYIAAVPGWKQDVCRRVDALISSAVPNVNKAVKWNSPMYGVEEGTWFMSMHCFTKYVKVAFFRGSSLRPPPPGESKQKDVRYLDIHEHDAVNEAQFKNWAKQASKLPGERM